MRIRNPYAALSIPPIANSSSCPTELRKKAIAAALVTRFGGEFVELSLCNLMDADRKPACDGNAMHKTVNLPFSATKLQSPLTAL